MDFLEGKTTDELDLLEVRPRRARGDREVAALTLQCAAAGGALDVRCVAGRRTRRLTTCASSRSTGTHSASWCWVTACARRR